jgi:5'-nucleotidase
MPGPARARLLRVAVTFAGTVAVTASLAATGAALGAPATAVHPGHDHPDHDRPGHHRNLRELQVLAVNDVHGNLEPIPSSSSSGRINDVPAGGAEFLASHLRTLRERADRRGAESVTVAAGDLIGGSPLLSAAFHDEPTIEALNEMGLEAASVGNHEFDEGWRELLRMQRGGCLDDGDGADNQNSCPDPDAPFRGADFDYLSANVFRTDTGDTLLPSVEIERYGRFKVGFIGMTLENTPNIVTKSGVEGLRFTDEVETANAMVPRLKRHGVKSIVVLLHEGGFPADRSAYNSCPGISGPAVAINDGLSPEIDAVISGHTHEGYNCMLPDPEGDDRLLTSASSFGRLVTEVRLTVNTRSGDVVRDKTAATNHIVTRDVTADRRIGALIAKYKELVDPIASKVIGHLGAASVTRTPDDSGESALGNLIADAQRADPTLAAGGDPVDVAFMNPGGIRADLVSDPDSPDNAVTYGAAFTVQPFNNFDVAMDMTGQQILELLEQQWSGVNAGAPKILQVSGIEYTYTDASPAGSKVDPTSVRIGGEPLDPAATYRVAANSFLSDGGDGFSVFAEATDKLVGGLDIDALARYLTENDPYTAVPQDRIDIQ